MPVPSLPIRRLLALSLLGVAAALLFHADGRRLPEHMALVAYALALRAAVVSLVAFLAKVVERTADRWPPAA